MVLKMRLIIFIYYEYYQLKQIYIHFLENMCLCGVDFIILFHLFFGLSSILSVCAVKWNAKSPSYLICENVRQNERRGKKIGSNVIVCVP